MSIHSESMTTGLTEKQCEALDLVLQHYSSKEISRILGISPRSVDQRLDAARARLGAATRVEAARIYSEIMRGAPQSLTSEPIHVPSEDLIGQAVPVTQVDPVFRFEDAANLGTLPELKALIFESDPKFEQGKLSPVIKLAMIIGGALVLLMLALVGLGVAQALEDLVVG